MVMEPEAKPKNAGGRPLILESVEEFNRRANAYFESTPLLEWTITGLAVALNTSRQTLMNYENRDAFFDAVKAVKDKIEMSYEIGLRKRGGAGDIFGLKNFNWTDRHEIESDLKSSDGSMSPKESVDKTVVDAMMAQLKDQTAKKAK